MAIDVKVGTENCRLQPSMMGCIIFENVFDFVQFYFAQPDEQQISI